MQRFTIDGVMTSEPGKAKFAFNCTAVAETVDKALDKFMEVYDPEWYQVSKITSYETTSE